VHLFVQAFVAGAAVVLPLLPWLDTAPVATDLVRWGLASSLLLHAAATLQESRRPPAGREGEYARAIALVLHGPFAWRHRWIGLGLGVVLPVLLLVAFAQPAPQALASIAALVGLFVEKDILVRAGQALPIS